MGDLIQLQLPAAEQPTPFYVTVCSGTSRCQKCGNAIGDGEDLIYRYQPNAVLCRPCADGLGVDYRPSKKWKRARRPHGSAA